MLIEKRVRSSEKTMDKLNFAAIDPLGKKEIQHGNDATNLFNRLINFESDRKSYDKLSEESRLNVDRAMKNHYRIHPEQKQDKRMQNLIDLRRSKGFKVQYDNKKKKFDDT